MMEMCDNGKAWLWSMYVAFNMITVKQHLESVKDMLKYIIDINGVTLKI